MKKILLILMCVVVILGKLFTQNYGIWVIPPYQINFFNTGPVVNMAFPDPPQPYVYSEAGIKPNGEMYFYVIDHTIYDLEDNQVGSLGCGGSMMNQVKIINVPGSMDKFYIIYGCVYTYDGSVHFALVDCSSGEPELIYTQQLIQTIEDAGFAITEESNNTRKLYVVAFNAGLSALKRYVITSNGIAFVNNIITPGDPTLNNMYYFSSNNVEISPDELTIAWAGLQGGYEQNVYVVQLNQQGSLEGSSIIPINKGRIKGIEFGNVTGNPSLYASCDNFFYPLIGGIFQINYLTGQIVSQLTANGSYAKTFLQTASDGYIYAVANDGQSIGRINQNNNSFEPSVLNNLTIKSSKVYGIDGPGPVYKLPSNKILYSKLNFLLASTPESCPGTSDGTASAIPTGGTPPYSYYWTPGGQTTQTIQNLTSGIYECCITDALGDIMCKTVEVPLQPYLFDYYDEVVFTSSATLTSWNKSFANGLRVKAGKNVTMIDCNLQFGKFAKVIVEPGGTLTLDGTTFKHFVQCGDMWQGVEVWGNKLRSQYFENNEYFQGKIVLKDNAVIENAITAVRLGKPGTSSFNGGIILANDAVFRNNAKSVHFLEYNNYYPNDNNKPADNISYFKYCDFEITQEYLGGVTFYKHADLARVKGIKFIACDFSTTPPGAGVDPYNHAIGSYSSGFSATAVCTQPTIPCREYDKCTFTGFYAGVYATNNAQNNNTFYINRAEFNNNAYGILATDVNNAAVLFSEFHIGFNDPESDPCDGEGKGASGYGIHMTGCTGFAIEENYFSKATGAPTGNYTGILCKDSETFHDVIYRNIFNGLSYGNFAEGNNRDSDDDLRGLEYQCNTNTANYRDFIVTSDNPLINARIRGYQGSMSREAGNTFSTGVQLPDGHFKNTGLQVINYCYNTNPPVYYTPYYVMPIPNAGANTCPSNYGGGSGGSTKDVVLTEDEKQEAELAFANNLSDFNNVKTLFDNLEDGGNTQALKTEVETAWPSDMWALRDELLGKSPHLSQEVLMAAADKTDVLPESILFEILSANPDELRKEELISHLENKDQPLPAYMISILRQLAGGVTYKTILQQDMARYHAGKTQAAYMLIRSCLNDTVSNNVYLRTWLNNLDNLNADLQIVAAYIAEENYATAQTMLNLIPATRSLEGNELAKYNDYKTLMQMQIAWQQQGRSIFELDSTEVAILTGFAEDNTGKAALMARGILEYAYGHNY
ncbi:MAG: SprB repeat-containing protein, partial [Bacteroidales bacterium]